MLGVYLAYFLFLVLDFLQLARELLLSSTETSREGITTDFLRNSILEIIATTDMSTYTTIVGFLCHVEEIGLYLIKVTYLNTYIY